MNEHWLSYPDGSARIDNSGGGALVGCFCTGRAIAMLDYR